MAASPLRYRRGAPIVLDLVVTDAGAIDPASVTVKIDLKPASGPGVPDAAVVKAASFAVAYVPAAGADPAYWRGTINAATSAALDERAYVADAVLSVGGTVIDYTDWVSIELAGTVTAP